MKPSPGRELIDLGGRQDEPAVRRVLGQSHGSTEALEEACAHYRSGEWTFIGWQEGEEILACAGAERLSSGTIGIRSIAVAPRWRNRGLGRTLIDALAERSGAKRVVAETDDDAVGFYRRCGFAVEDAPPKFGRARYWCVREIQTDPLLPVAVNEAFKFSADLEQQAVCLVAQFDLVAARFPSEGRDAVQRVAPSATVPADLPSCAS